MFKPFFVLMFLLFINLFLPSILSAHESHNEVAASSITRSFSVLPNKFAELNLNFEANKKILVKFNSDVMLAWNVHSHLNGSTTEHEKGEDKRRSVEFVSPREGVFSFLWKNKTMTKAKLEVEFIAVKGIDLHSWYPKKRAN